jgi:hypothetical protein
MDAAKQIHLIAKGSKRPSPHPDKLTMSSTAGKYRGGVE